MNKLTKVVLSFIAVVVIFMSAASLTMSSKNYFYKQTAEEKRMEVLSALRSEDLLVLLSDGKYDKDYSLVSLSGADPNQILARVRTVLVRVVDSNGQAIFVQSSIGYLSDDYVVTSINPLVQAENIMAQLLFTQKVETSMEVSLLPDKQIEDEWKIESGLEIKEVDKWFGLVVFRRTDPILAEYLPDYQVGAFDELTPGDALYHVNQVSGISMIAKASVGRAGNTDDGLNFIFVQGSVTPEDLGGPIFAPRDGRLELVAIMVDSVGIETRSLAIDISKVLDKIK